MLGLTDLWRCRNKIPNPSAAQSTFEQTIRIVKVTYDLLEPCEIDAKIAIQRSPGIKEASERPVFYRAGRLA